MRIESLKSKALTEQEKECAIKFISKTWNNSEQYTESILKMWGGEFEHEAFITAYHPVHQIWRNSHEKKELHAAIKTAFIMIALGENNDAGTDYELEQYLSKLYDLIALSVCDFEHFSVIPMSHQKDKPFEKDPDLALEYWQKALLLNPESEEAKSGLGAYYLFEKKNYHKAFAYLINNSLWDEDYFWFTEMGIHFDEERKKAFWDSANTAKKEFLCFKKAYKAVLLQEKHTVDLDNDPQYYYNLAFSYIMGVGTKQNLEKGLLILKRLDSLLDENSLSIYDIDDPDEIIRNYYMTSDN